jgi:hypothetical protein
MTRPPKIVLTAEQETYLRSEHAKGTTYKLIAKAMGMSRASFARRVGLLGLQRTSAERFRQQRARALKKRPRRRPPRPARPAQNLAAIVKPPRPRSYTGGVPLFELAANECRWPTGDWPPYEFCGFRSPPGISWCIDTSSACTANHGGIDDISTAGRF